MNRQKWAARPRGRSENFHDGEELAVLQGKPSLSLWILDVCATYFMQSFFFSPLPFVVWKSLSRGLSVICISLSFLHTRTHCYSISQASAFIRFPTGRVSLKGKVRKIRPKEHYWAPRCFIPAFCVPLFLLVFCFTKWKCRKCMFREPVHKFYMIYFLKHIEKLSDTIPNAPLCVSLSYIPSYCVFSVSLSPEILSLLYWCFW